MARSFDIADLMTSDGEYITDSVRRKINGNFRRVMQLMDTELPSQQEQAIANTVAQIVDGILENRLPEIQNELMDDMLPVGSVIVTATSADPRLSHGTWEQIGAGRYVRAAGDGVAAMEEGGSNVIVEANVPPLLSTKGYSYQGEGGLAGLQDVKYDTVDTEPFTPEYIGLLFYRRTK